MLWGRSRVRKKSGKKGAPEETGKSPPDEKVGIIRFDLFVVCVDLFVSRFELFVIRFELFVFRFYLFVFSFYLFGTFPRSGPFALIGAPLIYHDDIS